MSSFKEKIKVTDDDLATKYRAQMIEGQSNAKYWRKREKLKIAYELIELNLRISTDQVSDEEREKLESQLRIKAEEYSYYYYKNIGYWTWKIDPLKVSDETVNNSIKHATEKASDIFISFYESYKRKIDKGYIKKYCDNAEEDFRKAYKLYCLVNNIEENSDITIEELMVLASDVEAKQKKTPKQDHTTR
ncbi:MAG: hypothetical protein IJB90_05790 [Clostridia bacterium]|nr:hypothetical protein [Clostridia bacterium]